MVGLDLVLVSRHGRFRISIELDKVLGGGRGVIRFIKDPPLRGLSSVKRCLGFYNRWIVVGLDSLDLGYTLRDFHCEVSPPYFTTGN